MVSFIQFSPLSGAHCDKPVCSLLEIDQTKLLLDCGWEPPFDPEDLKYLKKYAKEIDCVLLTHGTLRHCGGLVYAYKTLGLTCPVYATFPVQIMGKFTLLEALSNLRSQSSFSLFRPTDVNHVFGKFSLLKYSQPQALSGKSQDIIITAYTAGHTMGGTFWKIKRNTEEFLYVMDIHHRKERHLAPSQLFATGQITPFTRPSVLLLGCQLSKEIPAKARDAQFLDPILHTLQRGGDVLVPVDAACRVLELAYVLDTYWHTHRCPYPIFWVSKCGGSVLRAAAGMLEWCSETLTQAFSATRESPFDLKSVVVTDSVDTVLRHRGPKLVLAADASLDMGPARELFSHLHTRAENLIVLPLAVPAHTLAHRLASLAEDPGPLLPAALDWTYPVRTPMSGDTLKAYLSAREQQTQTHAEASLLMQQNRSILEAELTDEEELDAADPRAAPAALFQGHDAYVYPLPSATTFPYIEHRRRVDDYGECIVHEEYVTEADRLERQAAQSQKDAAKGVADPPVWDGELESESAPDPFEYTQVHTTLHVHAALRSVDMNGLLDERSLMAMVPLLQAKKVLLFGSTGCPALLARLHDAAPPACDLFSPPLAECLNLSSSKDVQQVKLTDALSTAMEMQRYGAYDLGLVHAVVRTKEVSVPVLDMAAAAAAAPAAAVATAAAAPPPLVIGHLKLSEFKVLLDQEGYETKFVNGILIVNDRLGIFKPHGGELRLEGQLCKEYFQVRALLYKQHVIL